MSTTVGTFEHPRSSNVGRHFGSSITVRPGEAATSASFRHDAERQDLLKLIRQFSIDGLSWCNGQAAVLSELTYQTAERFLRNLPARKAFPKISPDGEGGLMMVWEGPSILLVSIDDLKVHMVVNATTPQADYLNDVVLGELIDSKILNAIPSR